MNCLVVVCLAICLQGVTYMLCDNMIRSEENGDDHSTFPVSDDFFLTRAKRHSHRAATRSRMLPSCSSHREYQVWVLQTASDRYNGTALVKQGPGIFYSTPPPSYPSPLPIPSVPYYLPFSLHSPPFPHTVLF